MSLLSELQRYRLRKEIRKVRKHLRPDLSVLIVDYIGRLLWAGVRVEDIIRIARLFGSYPEERARAVGVDG